jgi:TPR repeat protein
MKIIRKSIFAFVFLILLLDCMIASPVNKYNNEFQSTMSNYNKNPIKGISKISELAKKGNVEAQVFLGDLYLFGKDNIRKNRNKARFYFKKAAEKNKPEAFYGLGTLAQFRNNALFEVKNEQDWEEAKMWYEKATKFKHAHSARSLAFLYSKFNKAHYDPNKSKYWAEKCAEWGDVGDWHYIGIKFQDKVWFPSDFKRAEYWLKKAYDFWLIKANSGDASAQNMIGSMNYYGLGVQKNLKKAKKYIELSLKKEDKEARYLRYDNTRLLEKIEKEIKSKKYANKVENVFGIHLCRKITQVTKEIPQLDTQTNSMRGIVLIQNIKIPQQAKQLGFTSAQIGFTPITQKIASVLVKAENTSQSYTIFKYVKSLLEEKYGIFLYNYAGNKKIEYEKIVGNIKIKIMYLKDKKAAGLMYVDLECQNLQIKESSELLNKQKKDYGL